MPTDVLSLPASSVHTKWKEPYASASINQKLTGVIASGIYRGLRLVEDPLLGDRTVIIQADVDTGDHVAVYQNDDGYSVTYRDASSGDITISLTAYSSVTVVVSLFVDYQVGFATSGAFRVFTLAEYNALSAAIRDALVVLGTVTVPASGVVTSANISLLRRTLASSNFPRGAIINAPLVKNSNFEAGETNATYARSSVFWEKSVSVGAGTWRTSTTDVASGTKSIELTCSSIPFTGEITQQAGVETEEGELFLISVAIKQLKTISSGSISVLLEWSDANDALLTTTTVSLDGGGIDSSFRTVETIVSAPAGAASLRSVGVRAAALSPSGVGVFGYIDSLDVFVEPRNPKHPYPFDHAFRRALSSTALHINDKTGGFSSLASLVRFDAATPANEGRLVIEQPDVADLPPSLQIMGRLYKLGAGLLGSQVDALRPRISWDNYTSGLYTLLWESAPTSPGIGTVRQFVDSGGNSFVTENATYNEGTGQWNKDVNGQEAYRLSVGSLGVRAHYQNTGTNAWADLGWLNMLTLGPTGLDAAGPFLSNLTMAANRHVAISGTGQYKHGIKTMCVPLFDTFAGGIAPSGTLVMTSPNFTVRMFKLPVGKRIIRLRSKIVDSGTGPTRIRMALRRIDGGGSSARLYDGTQSLGNGTVQTITTIDFTESVTYDNVYGGEWYFSTGSTASTIRTLEVDYDEP